MFGLRVAVAAAAVAVAVAVAIVVAVVVVVVVVVAVGRSRRSSSNRNSSGNASSNCSSSKRNFTVPGQEFMGAKIEKKEKTGAKGRKRKAGDAAEKLQQQQPDEV